MAKASPTLVHFGRTNPFEVVAHMERLGEDRSGWIILDPEVDADDLEDAPRTGGLFSGRGPAVPELSWVPGQVGRKGVAPISVGIRHATGPKVAERLERYDHPVPDDWDVVDDSPKRGLVATLPPAADHRSTVDWLLRAAEALTAVPLTGNWRATIREYV